MSEPVSVIDVLLNGQGYASHPFSLQPSVQFFGCSIAVSSLQGLIVGQLAFVLGPLLISALLVQLISNCLALTVKWFMEWAVKSCPLKAETGMPIKELHLTVLFL